MKIYTGFGDKGNTALFGGETVKKNNNHVEMYGSLDELNSILGLLRNKNNDRDIEKILKHIQNELFVFGSEVATPDEKKRKLVDTSLRKLGIFTGNNVKVGINVSFAQPGLLIGSNVKITPNTRVVRNVVSN